jgi:replicative DNA helicase Mcm
MKAAIKLEVNKMGMPKPEIINQARLFLEQPDQMAQINSLTCKDKKTLLLDFYEISSFDNDLAEELLDSFTETIQCFQLAAAGMYTSLENETGLSEESKALEVYVHNVPKSCRTSINCIRSKEINKLIAIEGVIKTATKVKPRIRQIRFECPNCGQAVSVIQEDRKIKEPTRCSCGRKGRFITVQKFMIDMQKIELEETPENLTDGTSEMQRVHIFFEGLLTDPTLNKIMIPGNRVVIYGCVMEIPRFFLKNDEETTVTDMMFKANYIEILETNYEEVILTKIDEDKIFEISKQPDIISLLAKSIAPSIYGLSEVKEAIFLQQVGGVKKVKGDGTITRGIFHILLIGDPGTAKSKLLEYTMHIAPKGRLVVGGATTKAGITAAIVKDELTGTYALEAGALVLAHRGTMFLDEADKMTVEDSSALHEAMETGKVTRTGAGINASLPAMTSILAAANPKLGRFDPGESFVKQINMVPSLLSRFDAIFPVRDIPNNVVDSAIAQHILNGHQSPETMVSVIDPLLIKKYIAYAKKLEPKLTDEAVADIHAFYVDLRSKSIVAQDGSIKSIPITPRQLEAIIRLSEASAKARLSNVVELIDVARAKKLIWYYLSQLGMTESGDIDIDKITSTIASSERNKTVLVRDIMTRIEKELGGLIPDSELCKQCEEQGIQGVELERILQRLKSVGEIIEPKRGEYKRL